MIDQNFSGLGVALATPFRPSPSDGLAASAAATGQPDLDLDAFAALVRHVVSGGADYLVVLGSTGEAATIGDAERASLVRTAVAASGGLPVVVGVGHNHTQRCIELAAMAMDQGASALLVVSPYYNKPQPDGLVAHYQALATALPMAPIIVYNVPGRTGQNIDPATMDRLWRLPQVLALKEASGNLQQMMSLLSRLPEGKLLLSGDDSLSLAACALGAHGLISVLGNLLPGPMARLVALARSQDLEAARRLHYRLLPLMDAMFAETNPAPVKAGLACLGLGSSQPRLPLVAASPAVQARVACLLADWAAGEGA